MEAAWRAFGMALGWQIAFGTPLASTLPDLLG